LNQNLLPAPGALSTPISPPINSTMRLQIASPRPLPPWRGQQILVQDSITGGRGAIRG